MARTSVMEEMVMRLGEKHLSRTEMKEIRDQILARRRQFHSTVNWIKDHEIDAHYVRNIDISRALSRILFDGQLERYNAQVANSPVDLATWEAQISQAFWQVQMLIGSDAAREIYGAFEEDHSLPMSLTFAIGDGRQYLNPICRGLREGLQSESVDNDNQPLKLKAIAQVTASVDQAHPGHRQHCFDCQQIIRNAREGVF